MRLIHSANRIIAEEKWVRSDISGMNIDKRHRTTDIGSLILFFHLSTDGRYFHMTYEGSKRKRRNVMKHGVHTKSVTKGKPHWKIVGEHSQKKRRNVRRETERRKKKRLL